MNATARDGTPLAALIFNIGPRLCLLRHDTCGAATLAPSLALAKWEEECGVRATYFIWHELPNFGKPRFMDDVKRLRDRGHGIGLHYDVLPAYFAEGKSPEDELRRALDVLRKTGDVTMVAGHGNPSMYALDYMPYEVFDDFSRLRNVAGMHSHRGWGMRCANAAQLGVIEVYLHGEHNVSLSDSRGMWTGWRDMMPRPFERLEASKNLGLGVLDTLKDGDRVMLLLHPCYWNVK